MPDYDPTMEALIASIREALAPPDADAPRGYIEDLRAVQGALVKQLAEESPESPSPEVEQMMRQALGVLDPKSEDQYLGYGEVLRRLLSAVDRQLFIWSSGMVQPVGPSGDYQVHEYEEPVAAEEPRAHRAPH
jgi:hypothetical protein